MTKDERIKNTIELFIKTQDYYNSADFGFDKSILDRLSENNDFYSGVGQWPNDVKEQLKAEYRPALVINRCAPMINNVSGFERQNRTEIKPYPFETSDDQLATVMEYAIKHIHRGFKSKYQNSEGFLKGIVSSEANWEYAIDFGDDGLPCIERELLETGSVLWDPRSKRYDRSDAMFCIHNSWIGLDEFIELNPKVERQKIEMLQPDGDKSYGTLYDGYRNALSSIKDNEIWDKVNDRVRLIRIWRKKWKKEYIVLDRNDPKMIRRLSEEEMEGVDKTNPTLIIKPRMRPVFSYQMISGETELAYTENINLSRIPVVPFYCFFIEGYYFSLIDLAKDRQMQINKTDSVMMDYLARLPKLGAMAEESAFRNPADRNRFDKSRVGDSFVFADGALRENKVFFPGIKGMDIISYYNVLKEQMAKEMKEITGPSDLLQGIKPPGAQSGIAFDILRNQGLMIIEPILDNYHQTKELMGELEVEMIQKFFPPEKIERILGSVAIRYKDRNFQAIWEQARDDEKLRSRLVDVLMTTKYDIMMDEGLNTPTVRMANQAYFNQLMKSGFPVPPDLIIDNSPISQDQKEIWRAYIQQAQTNQMQGG